jgi:hypothetical protein
VRLRRQVLIASIEDQKVIIPMRGIKTGAREIGTRSEMGEEDVVGGEI